MPDTPEENSKPGGLTFEVREIENNLTQTESFYYHEGCSGGRQDDGEAEHWRRRRVAQCDGRGYREEAGGESEPEEVAGGESGMKMIF